MSNKRTPAIGTYATLNGRKVRWAGNDYGWQAPATYAKLEANNEFKIGGALLNRLGRQVAPAVQQVKNFQKEFRKATDKIPGIQAAERTVKRAVKADDVLPSSRVSQGGAIVAGNVAAALNIDPRLALGAGLLVGGVRNSAADSVDLARSSRALRARGIGIGTKDNIPITDAIDAAKAFQARRSGSRPSTAAPRRIRLKGGEIVTTPVSRSNKPARGGGDPLATTRATQAEAFLPHAPLGRPGSTRNLSGQRSTTGSPTTARVSGGGYKPAGRGNFADGQVNRFNYKSLNDPNNPPYVTESRNPIPDVKLSSDPIFGGNPGLDAGLKDAPDLGRRNPSRTVVTGRDGKRLRQLREQEALRDRTRSGNVTIQPSRTHGGNRIIYEAGSLRVTRQNPYDPDPGRARYRGRDVSVPRNATRDQLYEGNRPDPLDGGFDDKNLNNTGYRKDKKGKGIRGDSGAAANSVSNEIRQQLIREYRNSAADPTAILSTKRVPKGQPREVLKPGTGTPSDDWLNPRLNRAIAEHRARIDVSTGRRTPDSARPGNRFAGKANTAVGERSKKSGEPNPATYGGSMPPQPIKATDYKAAIPGMKGVHRQARGGRVRRSFGRPVRRWNSNLGESFNRDGESFARQQRAAMRGRAKSDPVRVQAQNARDPQLDRITRRRNQSVRARNDHFIEYNGVLYPKAAGWKLDKNGKPMLPKKGFGKPEPGVSATSRTRTGKHNTRYEGRHSRPVQVVPEAPEPKQRPRKGINPNNVSPESSGRTGSETGYDALRPDGRVEFLERSEELPLNKTSQRAVIDKTTGKIVVQRSPRRAPTTERRLNNVPVDLDKSRAQRYTEEMRRLRAAQRRAGLTGKQVTGGRITEAEAKKALEQLAREQRVRPQPLDKSGAGQIRAHNDRIRADRSKARLHDFNGVPLPPEVVQNPPPPWPNTNNPGKGYDPTTYGDSTAEQFKRSGELKGVTQRGRTKNKGRSSDQTKAANKLMDKAAKRKETGKSPSIRPRYKRNGTTPAGETYRKGDLKYIKPKNRDKIEERQKLIETREKLRIERERDDRRRRAGR